MTVVGLVAANCAQPQKTATRGGVDPRYGVVASPRVVEEGQPVPKGGGRAMVGKPYQVAGRTYVPQEKSGYSREGLASWYGSAFHGRLTANGEVFDRHSIAAAHTTMPLPSYARVTNVANGRSMIVRVNDRGPFHANRLIDVSEKVAGALEFRRAGTARVRVDYVGRASTNGSDDRKLMATLRTDGGPAIFPGQSPVLVAQAPPQTAPLAYRPLEAEEARETRVLTDRAPLAEPAPAAPPIRVVENVPLPPERPFDLGTIPDAATPVRAPRPTATLGPRAVHAGLFYAPEAGVEARFAKDDPFRRLQPQRFVALRNKS